MKLKLALSLLLLPATVQAGSSAYTLHANCPIISTENQTYTKTWTVPEEHQREGAVITSVYGNMAYSSWNEDLVVQLCMPDVKCVVIPMDFGTYAFNGESLSSFDYWYRVITPNGRVAVTPELRPVGMCSITVNYDFPDPPPPGPTPQQKAAALQSVYLLLLGD